MKIPTKSVFVGNHFLSDFFSQLDTHTIHTTASTQNKAANSGLSLKKVTILLNLPSVKNTEIPTVREATAAARTPPAEQSFAILANSCRSVPLTLSQIFSTAVLKHSRAMTKPMHIITAESSAADKSTIAEKAIAAVPTPM
jgi:hypothetical protein